VVVDSKTCQASSPQNCCRGARSGRRHWSKRTARAVFVTSLRLLRSIASAWRRDFPFRSLMFLAAITLFGGTIFYSSFEG
jgi:hypothetical protein